uniref:Uncharacterized protein n=1 Tax=Romanomermis culicivorax TaxID=13658 RepID=A0A915KX96_ROMCU
MIEQDTGRLLDDDSKHFKIIEIDFLYLNQDSRLTKLIRIPQCDCPTDRVVDVNNKGTKPVWANDLRLMTTKFQNI